MPNYKCKMCGGELLPANNDSVTSCPYCFSKQAIPSNDDEKRVNLFNRANHLRKENEFDRAILAYQSIINEFPNESEAYWGLLLSKYGVEYVDDPFSKKKIPTIHRTNFAPIKEDEDYLAAIKYADVLAKEEYEIEANEIEKIQRNFLSISSKEEAYDIFICYKENDEAGNRSLDSVKAYEIYEELKDRYKIFFARVSLEDKLGNIYEPYIYQALRTSKIMLVVTSKKQHVDSVWVKNEWKRFLELMKEDDSKKIIPCYLKMDPYDLPDELSIFQAQDLSKLGYLQDLSRGIDKLMGRDPDETKYNDQIDKKISPMLKRVEILLDDNELDKANEVLDDILNIDPTNFRAYLYKLLLDYNCKSLEDLSKVGPSIKKHKYYLRALSYGNDLEKAELMKLSKQLDEAKYEASYLEGLKKMENREYVEAIEDFKNSEGYKDAAEKIEECSLLLKEKIYRSSLYEAKRVTSENEARILEKAIEDLTKLDGYKDSEKYIEHYSYLVKNYRLGLVDDATEEVKKSFKLFPIFFFGALIIIIIVFAILINRITTFF